MLPSLEPQYTAASSRAKALEFELLSENQLERLIGAHDKEEITTVLQDTFLQPYVSKKEVREEAIDMGRMLRKSLSQAKKTLAQMSQDDRILDILWLRYDYFNLKVIIKGRKADQPTDTIIENCFFAGKYSPETLIKYIDDGILHFLAPEFRDAYEDSQRAQDSSTIDVTMNRTYFKHALRVSAELQNQFAVSYVKLLINLFNIQGALRLYTTRNGQVDQLFVDGGTLGKELFSSKESVLDALQSLGDEDYWTNAISDFKDTGNFTTLQKAMDDFELSFIKQHDTSIFSPVPLFAFFIARRNTLQIIRTIVVAKESNVPETELRKMLRRLYV